MRQRIKEVHHDLLANLTEVNVWDTRLLELVKTHIKSQRHLASVHPGVHQVPDHRPASRQMMQPIKRRHGVHAHSGKTAPNASSRYARTSTYSNWTIPLKEDQRA